MTNKLVFGTAVIIAALLVGLATFGIVSAQEEQGDTTEDNDVTVTKTVDISDNQVVNISCTQSQVSNQEAANAAVQTAVNSVEPQEVDTPSEATATEQNLEQTIEQDNPQGQTNCTIIINNNGNQNVTPTPSATATPTASPTASPSVAPSATPSVVRVTVPSFAPSTGRGG